MAHQIDQKVLVPLTTVHMTNYYIFNYYHILLYVNFFSLNIPVHGIDLCMSINLTVEQNVIDEN